MSVIGQDVLAKNIVKFTKRFLVEVNTDMQKVQKLLYREVISNISKSDSHEGHPYAIGGSNPHDPEYSVHMISGRLVNAVYSGTEDADVSGGGVLNAAAYVGVDDSLEYAKYVLFGTSKMIPRNFLIGTREQVKSEALDILKRSLNGVVISFDGEKVKL